LHESGGGGGGGEEESEEGMQQKRPEKTNVFLETFSLESNVIII